MSFLNLLLFGEQGTPIRATISEMGPLLLSRLMNLSEVQEGVLNIAFKIADEEKLPLVDLKDLQALLENLAARAADLTTKYGNITKASVGSIQRSLLVLEQQGGAHFFGEPALKISDLMRTARDGRGYISILAAQKLMDSPRLYATFLLILMSELFEQMPEVGDPDKPKLVFFFDEAHLLFNDAPKALLQKVEQVVRLIRSKGVGVYFVTQNPLDVPDTVSSQLGNRVQHALRAFTPMEQKAVRAARLPFAPTPPSTRRRPSWSLASARRWSRRSTPRVSQPWWSGRSFRPPNSRVGPVTDAERKAVIKASPVAGEYDETVDREPASEILQKRTSDHADADTVGGNAVSKKKSAGSRSDGFWTTLGKTIIKSAVPAGTRILENAIKRGAFGGKKPGGGGGGFTGIG